MITPRTFLASALILLAAPAFAQTPSRAIETLEKVCANHARDATPLPELVAATGAIEVKNPLWPEYKADGYPEKAYAWSDASDTFAFILTSRWTNVPPKCTLFIRAAQADQVATLAAKLIVMDKEMAGGINVTVSDHGQYMMLTEGLKQFRGEVTLGKNKKFGEFALISLSRSMSYRPPAPAEPAPASAPVQ